MKSYKKALIYGVLLWLLVFLSSFIVYPIHDSNRPLFESFMPVSLSLFTVIFSLLYFKNVKKNYLSEGIKLGLIWLAINIVIDLFMFMWGPMKMGILEYFYDIGLTYLMFPILTVGFGKILSKK